MIPDTFSGSGSGFGSGSGYHDNQDNSDDTVDDLDDGCDLPTVFPFTIDNTTGVISLAYPLDHETNTSWTFSVTATDQAMSPLTSTAKVAIEVNDVNDEPPTFTESAYTIQPLESAPVGKILTDVVKAEDKDTVGELRYSISGGDGRFDIDRENGDITLVQPLQLTTYVVLIQVFDGVYDVEVNLTVIVQDINNNAPMFEQSQYLATFPESATTGYSIVQVQALDADPGINGIVEYSIVGGDLFYINTTSGVIYANSTNYDYDNGTKEYVLMVRASDGNNTDMANVTLTLTDVNDNAPQLEELYSTDLQEGIQIDKFVYDMTDRATDPDSGINAEITYSLLETNDSELFYLKNNIIFANGDFDYDVPDEEDRIIYLIIQATDGGDPALSTNTTLEIMLTDINDNAPVFAETIKNLIIPETTQVDQDAFVVVATDADSGDNANLIYSITDSSCNDTYTINATSGAVRLTNTIDVESAVFDLECSLTITATDQGNPPRSSFVVYVVTVTDINEFTPIFNSSLIAYVPENSPAGYQFYTILVTDKDPNPMSYTLVGGAVDLFKVGEYTGILSVAESDTLDYESIDKVYNLTIEGLENGRPTMTITQTIIIIVTDINDEAPVFENATYVASVREIEPVGHTITMVRALDYDTALPNIQVRYKFILNSENETDYGKFAVDDVTGAITIATKLDYELEQRTYNMMVEASDGVHQATTTLRIRVLESNDNHPNITNLPAMVSIREDANNGTYIYTVMATDKDTGVNRKITYTLGEEDRDLYRIDPDTGVIRVNDDNIFDYESGNLEMQITVIATDRAGEMGSGFAHDESGFGMEPITDVNDEQLSTQSILTIEITDANDEVPTFSQDSYTATIVEHEVNTIFVLQVVATDGDQPGTDNSKVQYKISDGAFGKFIIGSDTGIIITKPPIDRETTEFFILVVTAYDFGIPSNEKNVTVTITVLDANDKAPQFTSPIYTGTVMETQVQEYLWLL